MIQVQSTTIKAVLSVEYFVHCTESRRNRVEKTTEGRKAAAMLTDESLSL